MSHPKPKTRISVPQLKKKVQRAVNKYVRERDKDRPCISCNKHGDKEAGHYIAQGSSGFLRYDITNIHGQCRACNRFKHGNLIEYRINLIKRIGKKEVEKLENLRTETHKWTRDELEELLKGFK